MHLLRFRIDGPASPFRVGLLQGARIFDLSSRYASIAAFCSDYPGGWSAARLELESLPTFARSQVQMGSPVDDGASVYLVGANYRKHAEEAGLDVPKIPVIFMKPTSAFVGPGEAIELPPVSSQMDYEGELAVVIGRPAHRVSRADAPGYVAGVTIVNDVTARDLQWVELGKNRIVDWLSSKCLARSSPIGPWIVPIDAVGDPHRLHLCTRLNGKLMQDSDTSLMVFDVWALIEFLSARVALRAGDIISTGTPYGVGGFRQIFLQHGDVLSVTIDGIGTLENPVVKV